MSLLQSGTDLKEKNRRYPDKSEYWLIESDNKYYVRVKSEIAIKDPYSIIDLGPCFLKAYSCFFKFSCVFKIPIPNKLEVFYNFVRSCILKICTPFPKNATLDKKILAYSTDSAEHLAPNEEEIITIRNKVSVEATEQSAEKIVESLVEYKINSEVSMNLSEDNGYENDLDICQSQTEFLYNNFIFIPYNYYFILSSTITYPEKWVKTNIYIYYIILF